MKLQVCVMAMLIAYSAVAGEESVQDIYNQWRKAVTANPLITEPLYFDTNPRLPELSAAVEGLRRNRFRAAEHVCAKVAADAELDELDAAMLSRLAGINFFFIPGRRGFDQDIGANMAMLFREFKTNWNAGIYRNPAVQVKSLSAKARQEKGNDVVTADALLPLRQFGIFGAPALLEEVEQSNSAHAFGALLIIFEDRVGYSDYLEGSKLNYRTKEEKLAKLRELLRPVTTGIERDHPIVKEIARKLEIPK